MVSRLSAVVLVAILGCGGKTAAPPPIEETVPDDGNEEVVAEAPPDAAPEPPPPPDPWDTALPGDEFSPAAPAPWAALMRPNAAWTLLDVETEAVRVRVTVEQVTKESIGHVALLKWEWHTVDTSDGEDPTYGEGEGGTDGFGRSAPRRIAVSSKGVWWDDKDTGAFAKKPTFAAKVVKKSTQGTTVCLEILPKKGEECEDDVCGALCVDGVDGIVSGRGDGWPMGYFESESAGGDEEGEEEGEEEEEE